MEEKKLTDEEIVKALECLTSPTACVTLYMCEKCACTVECEPYYAMKGALDLINRQKAEIERLTEEIKTTNGMTAEQVIESEKLKTSIAEAVNSFVRLETLYKVKCKELEIANKKLEELNGGKVD